MCTTSKAPTPLPARRGTALLRGGGEEPSCSHSAAVPSKPTVAACPRATGTAAPAPPRRLACHNPQAVLDDAAAGAELMTFNRATGLKLLYVRGRRPHVALLHRASDPSRPYPLEAAVVNGVKVTSEPAIRRWIARSSQAPALAPSPPTQQQEQRRRERTEQKLDALGIRYRENTDGGPASRKGRRPINPVRVDDSPFYQQHEQEGLAIAAPSNDFESGDFDALRTCSLPARGLCTDMRVLMKARGIAESRGSVAVE